MRDAPLAAQAWTSCSRDAVALAFLQAEWEKWSLSRIADRRLIDHANLDEPAQNDTRYSLLRHARGSLLDGVPPDTHWFEVRHLTVAHLPQLLVINHIDWSPHTPTNALLDTAQARPEPMRTLPTQWAPTIIWGHGMDGPFTILEGNHRLTALATARDQYPTLRLVIYVGLSGQACGWHRPDGVW